MAQPLWIFGYGSLVWRPAFAFAERRPGYIRGFHRRFWQGSTDHRGIPGAPGRVVTLVPAPAQVRCWGVAFRVAPGSEDEVLGRLDHREQGGYERREVRVECGRVAALAALVYLATPANPHWLGQASLAEMAGQIRAAKGPSGTNLDYLLRLHEALATIDAIDAIDEHVASLVELATGGD